MEEMVTMPLLTVTDGDISGAVWSAASSAPLPIKSHTREQVILLNPDNLFC